MTDDYLWDGSGPVDPEIARLESTLGSLKFRLPPPDPASRAQPAAWRRSLRISLILAAAAVLSIVLFARGYYRVAGHHEKTPPVTTPLATPPLASGPAWEVKTLAGTPEVAGWDLGDAGRLAVGEWLVTDSLSRAELSLPGIGAAGGRVEVAESSRLSLKVSHETEHRLELARGRIDATIWAPPRLFFVDTPAATAVDYGCKYSLEVDEQGAGVLQVTLGWVALEEGARSSHVPRGARCLIRPGVGPGTPHFDDASTALVSALTQFDFESPAAGPAAAAAALATVLEEARGHDTLTLWHLLARVDAAARAPVADRIYSLAELGEQQDRQAVLALDPEAVDRLKSELEMQWW